MLCPAALRTPVFIDGNKRPAYGVLVMTLAGNGLRPKAEDIVIAERIIEAAGSAEGWEALATWVVER